MFHGVLRTGWLLIAIAAGSIHAKKWSFSVISDPRGSICSYRRALCEIRDMTSDPVPNFPHTEMVFVNGDIGCIRARFRICKSVFRNDPLMKGLYPVIGNHETTWQKKIITRKIIPKLDSVCTIEPHPAHYCVDWNNARFLIFNQYATEAPDGCLDHNAIKWATQCIEASRADPRLDHVFVFIHEPAFPRYRHLDDSFNKCPQQRDAFWRTMVANRDVVRAVFCGHTHTYSRIKVADPESKSANDPTLFPLQRKGVYQIDSGAAGQGETVIVVRIAVNDTTVSGRTVQANKQRRSNFRVIDEWLF